MIFQLLFCVSCFFFGAGTALTYVFLREQIASLPWIMVAFNARSLAIFITVALVVVAVFGIFGWYSSVLYFAISLYGAWHLFYYWSTVKSNIAHWLTRLAEIFGE